MFVVTAIVPLLILILVGVASAVICRRWWVATPWLSLVFAVLGIGLVAHVIWIAYWLLPIIGVALSISIIVASIVAVVLRFRFDWRSWAPFGLLFVSVAAVAFGFAFLWGGVADPFTTIANRIRIMPPDNVIQYLFADRLWKHQSTHLLIGDWNGSDRPPLQSGVLLLIRPVETLFGLSPSADNSDSLNLKFGIAGSIASQLLWIPAVYALVRSLGFQARVALVTVAFAAALPLSILNTVYTWPKMLSAAFAIAGLALLLHAIRSLSTAAAFPIGVATVLETFAILSHGGAAFALPVFVVLDIILLRRCSPRRAISAVAGAAIAVSVIYLPWIAYGKFADPSHDRLLKWHLAGHIPPDYSTFLYRFVQAYASTPVRELIAARVSNIQRVLDVSFIARLGKDGIAASREQDFFSTPWAIGLGSILLVGFLCTAVGLRVRRVKLTERGRTSVIVLIASLASMFAWSLILFLPDAALVHQGSYIWLLIFAAIPFAWLVEKRPGLAFVVFLVQLTYAVVAYAGPIAGHPAHVSVAALALTITGAIGVTVACVSRRRRTTSAPLSQPDEAPAGIRIA